MEQIIQEYAVEILLGFAVLLVMGSMAFGGKK